MKKFLFALAIILFSGLGFFAFKAQAAQLDLTIDSSDGSNGSALLDDDYNSTEHFDAGTTLTLNASEPIDSVYIKWDSIPSAWKMKDGSTEVSCGQYGFLHEFVQLSGTSNSATITVPTGGATIADVFAFSAGELPSFVEQWQPSWERPDILFISTHSDDEVLFFGGMIPIYTNEDRARVQVAYFSDFFLTESYRNHELLDGIWTMGVDHYPQLGKFYDNYSESLEEAEAQFEHDECLGYIVDTIRKFQPQVVVTHDVNGEYGHGGHQYVSKLVREAVEITNDASQYSESANTYGTWDVPKTYLHLWEENPIEMDTRAPLSDFGGKCALDVAKEAYLKHGSQQWMWFYVDDGYDDAGNPNDYKYSCAKYGLYRSTVGADTSGNDVLDNIITYAQQEAKAEQESIREEETTEIPAKDKETDKKSSKALIVILIIIAVIIAALVVFYFVARARQKKRRAEMARRARQRRAQAQRRQTSRSRPQNRGTAEKGAEDRQRQTHSDPQRRTARPAQQSQNRRPQTSSSARRTEAPGNRVNRSRKPR